jgi:PleD family two-component response regulator
VLDRNSTTVADVLDAADRACYAAKAGGRNAIVVAGAATPG